MATALREAPPQPHPTPGNSIPATPGRPWLGRALLVAGVACIGALAVVLRTWGLMRFGINSDEAVYSGQAAALAGDATLLGHFSPFRAHPVLFQFVVSVAYRIAGVSDQIARLVAVGLGLATIPATYLAGRAMFTRRVALGGAALVAVAPYHVIVSRQAMLEVPLTLFVTLCLWAFARYRVARTWRWALLAGWLGGLAFLSKEAGILVLGIVAIVVAVEGGYRRRHLALALAAFAATAAPHLAATRIGHEASSVNGWGEYLIWQVSRPANHPFGFYAGNVESYLGWPLAVLAAVGVVLALRRRRRDPSLLLPLAWVAGTIALFQVWPVKGYHYLLPALPAACLLGAYAFEAGWQRLQAGRSRRTAQIAAAAALVALVGATGLLAAGRGPFGQDHGRIGEAGFSGIPGGREAALWLRDHSPAGARVLTIGPSAANIIRYYADRDAFAISVSPNPLRANPAYAPVRNADYELRWGLVEYLVFDSYSADRSPHFGHRLLDLAARYGTLVHEETVPRPAADGRVRMVPAFRVYRVNPVGSG